MRPGADGCMHPSELRKIAHAASVERVPSQTARTTTRVNDSIERVSFELTAGALAEQERRLSSIRSGATTVLGSASIAGSFLGGRTAGRSLDAWAILAMLAFALCVGAAIRVLLPREMVLSFRGNELITTSDAFASREPRDGYRAACDWIESYLECNRGALDDLSLWLTRAFALLAIEVVLWTISIIA
jgi:hypothetical protein